MVCSVFSFVLFDLGGKELVFYGVLDGLKVGFDVIVLNLFRYCFVCFIVLIIGSYD